MKTLKDLIKKQGKTVKSISKETGIGYSRLLNITNGKTKAKDSEIEVISKNLEIPETEYEHYYGTLSDSMYDKIRAKIRAIVIDCIDQHERHKNAWFWRGDFYGNSSARRRVEQRETWSETIYWRGHEYYYESSVSLSAAHYYYTGTFSVDGEGKNLRAFKKLLKELTAEEEMAA